MEPTVAGETLKPSGGGRRPGGRPWAALPLFLALLAGCAKPEPARVAARWRDGLGACSMDVGDGGRLLAVACGRSNDVWLLALPGGAFVARVDTRPKPRAVHFAPNDRGFYVAAGLTDVALVSLDGARVERRFSPPWPIDGFAFEPSTRRLFCAQVGLPVLGVYRPSDMHLEDSLAVGGEVRAVAFVGGDAWVVTRRAGALVRVSLKQMSVLDVAVAGPEPGGLALDEAAGLAYIPCRGGGREAYVPVTLDVIGLAAQPGPASQPSPTAQPGPTSQPGPTVGPDQAPIPSGLKQDFDGSGVAVLRLKDVRRVDYIDVAGGPLEALLSPSGGILVLACADGQLRFLDVHTRKVLETLDLGGRPGALVAEGKGGRLLVALRDSKSVLEIAPGGLWR